MGKKLIGSIPRYRIQAVSKNHSILSLKFNRAFPMSEMYDMIPRQLTPNAEKMHRVVSQGVFVFFSDELTIQSSTKKVNIYSEVGVSD